MIQLWKSADYELLFDLHLLSFDKNTNIQVVRGRPKWFEAGRDRKKKDNI